MFCLPNKFGLFTNHKQPLKCVWQNNYLDLWSNTLYIIWQGVHLLVKLLEELINKLLTRRNLSQAFLIHFTLYLYLWWRVSRPICIFWKVSKLDENSLGMIVLMSFLWKCKWKKFWSLETCDSVSCVCYMYIFFIYKAPGDLWVEYGKRKWLALGEWGCLLDNGPKLALGQPNSS